MTFSGNVAKTIKYKNLKKNLSFLGNFLLYSKNIPTITFFGYLEWQSLSDAHTQFQSNGYVTSVPTY